jgi:hypothetical protein
MSNAKIGANIRVSKQANKVYAAKRIDLRDRGKYRLSEVYSMILEELALKHEDAIDKILKLGRWQEETDLTIPK